MAAPELHISQWQIDFAGARQPPHWLVFDLDLGPGASIVDSCRVLEQLRGLLAADRLTGCAETSAGRLG